MIPRYFLPAAALSVLCLAITWSPPGHTAIKCWTNKEGVRECGNVVPPEYAQEGHEEISTQGMVVKEKGRALTEEELAEQRRRAEEEAKQKRLAEEQAKRDMVLLQTFSTEEDIMRARDYKVSALEGSIRLAQGRIEKIKADLDKRVAQAAAEERSGKAPSESLLKDIESLRRQIKDNEEFIEEKRAEQEKLRTDYDADLERFRELKAAGR